MPEPEPLRSGPMNTAQGTTLVITCEVIPGEATGGAIADQLAVERHDGNTLH
jgi:hypothetical protein